MSQAASVAVDHRLVAGVAHSQVPIVCAERSTAKMSWAPAASQIAVIARARMTIDRAFVGVIAEVDARFTMPEAIDFVRQRQAIVGGAAGSRR